MCDGGALSCAGARGGVNVSGHMLALPGLVDAHVHLRTPGATHKEDVLTGTTAALAGGFVAVLDMPNTTPPTIDGVSFDAKEASFGARAVSDYGLFFGYDGGDVSALRQCANKAVGLKLYLDQTFGEMMLSNSSALASVFEAWPGPGPIAIHAESRSIPHALELARRYSQRLHVCHVPHPDDLVTIDRARQNGTVATCEVTPHHLFLSRRDADRLGPYGLMKPPLLGPRDVGLYWERLDLVDIVASDHAPHTREEKESAAPPPGVPGLETTLPLLLHAVDRDRLSIDRMIELVCTRPVEIFGLSMSSGAGVGVMVDQPYVLPARGYHTRCGWSPFEGKPALGRVETVTLRGQTVWERNCTTVAPGYGRSVVQRT